MQIVCISRGSESRGIELAESLAGKLGYPSLTREELLEQASRAGIAVEKLNQAMTRSQTLPEPLLLEREHYHAFVTTVLCEHALKGDLVYHGRTGHLLLPSVSHVFRIRVVADLEYRINSVMHSMNLTREEAKDYIDEVEAERRRWVRQFYNVEWDEVSLYDVILNLERVNTANAAQSLCSMAQLPDFQQTPASRRALEDLYLGAQARLALARDERTYFAHLTVHATSGKISVVYQPLQSRVVQDIPKVLEGIEGVREVVCTSAGTGILWIQERYDPKQESFGWMTSLANKWDAAVELLQFTPAENNGAAEVEEASDMDDGVDSTVQELIGIGRSAGSRSIRGDQRTLVTAVDPTVDYSLLVLGDLFLKKGHSARTRMSNELRSFLSDNLHVPVISIDELNTQYLFGGKQLGKLLLFLVLTACLYLVVFQNQETVLRLLSPETFWSRCLAAVGVVLFVPVVAYLYGTAARLLLRLIRIE